MEENKPTEITDDIEFLSEDMPEDVVSHDVALADFRRWLRAWKLQKKAVRHMTSKDVELRETATQAKDKIVHAIMDGTLEVIDEDGRVYLRHNLYEPMGTTAFLTYRSVVKLIDSRRMDEFKEQALVGRTQGLISAMSGKSVAECKNISQPDAILAGAIYIFFA